MLEGKIQNLVGVEMPPHLKKNLILFASILIYSLCSVIATAGDFASRNIIGFSKDGTNFAFEEFGVQDGSGFPYANIYLINTEKDQWVAGSPWRILLQNEEQTEEDARQKVRELAGNNLLDITEPGFIAATNRYTEIPYDPSRFSAMPRSYIPSGVDPLNFKLEHLNLPASDFCSQVGDTKGFKLSQILTGGDEILLHQDSKVPKSRNCPIEYSFADIVTFGTNNGPNVFAVLLLIKSYGFEGPNGRYLAITSKF